MREKRRLALAGDFFSPAERAALVERGLSFVAAAEADMPDLLQDETLLFGAALAEDASLRLWTAAGELSPAQCFLLLTLLQKQAGEETFFLPVWAPELLFRFAGECGLRVERAGTERAEQLAAMRAGGARTEARLFADGRLFLFRLLELLDEKGMSLAALLAELPAVFWREECVSCGQAEKGALLRCLAADKAAAESGADGVYLCTAAGRGLVSPDAEEDCCRIWCSGPDMETAEEIAAFCRKKLGEYAGLGINSGSYGFDKK